MQVTLNHLKKLFSTNAVREVQFDLADLKSANIYNVSSGAINFRKHVDMEYLNELEKKRVEKVSVCIDKNILNQLRTLFPDDYSGYQFEEEPIMIKKRLELIKRMNQYSSIQRQLVLKQEIIKTSGIKQSIMLYEGTVLTAENIDVIIAAYDSRYKAQYSYNEDGILIFVDDPVKNIMLKIDMLALLSQLPHRIMFSETLDDAICMFQNTRPRIVLMTNLEKAWETKGIFLECIKADPFFHYINYDGSPAKNRGEEISRINALYLDNYESKLENFLANKNLSKPPLEGKIRNPLMDKIEYLRNNYSKKGYYELRYYIYRVGQKYNVTTIENIIDKICS